MKFAEFLLNDLKLNHKYTHCFFVAGGNIMHLLDSARNLFECVPVINEVAAGIATEYFNETRADGAKSFALVTAGPGLTNIVTALAGAYLESRELLVIGGQVKSSDLKTENLRQRGIQEIDGRSIVEPITNYSIRVDAPLSGYQIEELMRITGRPGPIFLEIPLDVQAQSVSVENKIEVKNTQHSNFRDLAAFVQRLVPELKESKRPILLLGGGLSRKSSGSLTHPLSKCGIPIMTTWNGMDRYGSDQPNYWGRPNTWGQRSSNILIQQSDLIIAIGTRLGLQQTGFAWRKFAPLAKIFQVDIDKNELNKGHPRISEGLAGDADEFLVELIKVLEENTLNYSDWLTFGEKVMAHFPLNDKQNITNETYISPYEFVEALSDLCTTNDVVIPCSSGGAFTVMMQSFKNKNGQKIVTNKGLASMGYGLSGAIGAAIATKSRTILVEGDGGFAQNLQELGTVASQNLNLKIFLFSNSGYASIRMTQKNYFDGAYLGCDTKTGLGLPDWSHIAKAYDLPYVSIDATSDWRISIEKCMQAEGPQFIEVKIDPEQTYFPKITSRILPNGEMESSPLHLMSPDLTDQEIESFLPFLKDRL